MHTLAYTDTTQHNTHTSTSTGHTDSPDVCLRVFGDLAMRFYTPVFGACVTLSLFGLFWLFHLQFALTNTSSNCNDALSLRN